MTHAALIWGGAAVRPFLATAMALPDAALRRLAGAPVVLDGHELDARTQLTLAVVRRAEIWPMWKLPPRAARAQMDLFGIAADRPDGPVSRVVNRTIPGPAGEIPVRIYGPDSGGSRLPAIVHFHGGGFVVGSIASHDSLCRKLARWCRAVVVSVGYRLAPEHPFPAAVDDALAAFRWTAAHASEIGADAERVAVAGDSAGGNLAAVVAQATRDEGGPKPCFQLLIYPLTDHLSAHPSRARFGRGFLLDGELMRWFMNHYATPQQAADPRCSPLRARDLSGLPPSLVLTAGFDPLRDEGEEYAERLRAAGVETTCVRAPSLIHGFAGMGMVPEAMRILRDAAAHTARVLHGDSR